MSNEPPEVPAEPGDNDDPEFGDTEPAEDDDES
jgi:hypothetical protein